MLEKLFKLKENNTTVSVEVMAGITTFMTMAYILAVNPDILSASGMDKTAILLATCIASFIGTICMALLANYPFALSAGLGLNAYFAYTVCGEMGYSWQIALLAVYCEGLIFIGLSLTNAREAIFNAIPTTLKSAVSVGIGLFIAFIGLQNSGIVVGSATLVTMTDFTENFKTSGITALLALIGLFIIITLYIKKISGSILIGIISTWVLAMICEVTKLYVPNPESGFYSVIPSKIVSFDFSPLGKTFGQCFKADMSGKSFVNFLVVICAFLFVDVFDTLGTLIGVSSKAGYLDKDGKLPRIRPALLADAIATTSGAVLGTSTTTTFVESSAGVAAGGRTGLTSVITGFLFLLSMFFAPLFTTIPSCATAPALIFVGFMMFGSVTKLDFSDGNLLEAIPAYLCIIAMPLFYSISDGIALGIISYCFVHIVGGKAKDVKPLMYVLSVLFILKYIFL
ncbi:NCS2 family permease [Eubacterium sp.]|uniref:NCS2 family permease n=1 Tax=Eubacterium sp. TaxID=142586 RepID=UPI0025DC5ACC|nr:NCS2 family permease [Eubacterium sp.]MCR5628302.1 NCS2 family permease [Eubacterium sp.]